MGLREYIYHFAGQRLFERPGEALTLPEHAEVLRSSGAAIRARLAPVRAGARHRETLRHVVGIERWGQRHLRVLLGEPFVDEGYQPYRPAEESSWADLLEQFSATREETIRLVGTLAETGAGGTVPHAQFGEMSALGWLRYLNGHAELETRRLR